MKKNKMIQWLDSKVNDNTIENKSKVSDNSLKHYMSKYPKYYYYTEDDIDLNSHNNYLYNLIKGMSREELENDIELLKMNNYMDHLLLSPNTNRYHANSLFRQLLDHSINNEFNYLLNDENKEKMHFNLIDNSLKNSFYKFCYENS